MAFNQLTDEQIDDEILRMVIEESTNMTDNNDINGDEDDEILRMAIQESTNMTDNNNYDEILHTVLEESKKSIISENFVDIVKKNDKFLSETINRFNKLQNIKNIDIEKKDIEKKDIEKKDIEKKDIEKIENTPLTLEQLREKRLKRFTQV